VTPYHVKKLQEQLLAALTLIAALEARVAALERGTPPHLSRMEKR
jgi:hypothetical protein